jgi:hypothetical protein
LDTNARGVVNSKKVAVAQACAISVASRLEVLSVVQKSKRIDSRQSAANATGHPKRMPVSANAKSASSLRSLDASVEVRNRSAAELKADIEGKSK